MGELLTLNCIKINSDKLESVVSKNYKNIEMKISTIMIHVYQFYNWNN